MLVLNRGLRRASASTVFQLHICRHNADRDRGASDVDRWVTTPLCALVGAA
jgi:hypothetical protein